MERLTEKSKSGMVWFIDRENNDTRLEPCEMDSHHSRLAIQKLAEYEDLEAQGLLLKLPCKVGDTVYAVTRDFISEYTICSIVMKASSLIGDVKMEYTSMSEVLQITISAKPYFSRKPKQSRS